MASPLRIMMVSGTFLPTVGGAEVATYRLAGRLIEKGVKVSMVTPQRDLSWPERETFDNGLEVFRLKQSPTPKIGTAGYLWRLVRFLRSRKDSYDLLHACFLDPSTLVTARVRAGLGKPALCRLSGGQHTGDVARIESKPLRSLWWKTFRGMDAFVVMSRHLKEELESAGISEEQICIIPNGVDTNLFRPADAEEKLALREKSGLDTGARILLYVGRLSEEKGVGDLVDAFRIVAEQDEKVRLCLVGDGPLRRALEERCKSLGLCSRVHFVGKVESVREYVAASDLFVLPSLAEGMPNALLEAMACRLPCVGTNIGGTVDVISHQHNGLLAEAGKPESLAGAIQLLLDDPGLAARLAAQAYRTAKEKFSLDRAAMAYIELYQRLLSMEGRAG